MKILRLKKEVYELIAAGEVIERPASIAKELIENSIDAGATSIDIEIHRGGKESIRVTDNGTGIAKSDCKNVFVSHATSKVYSKSDLENINTLGFRGEALASVAAVSRVSLLTKTKEAKEGIKYIVLGGQMLVNEPCGCAEGTTIVVEDLFYNTPARLKFLKRDATEAGYVEDIVSRIAMSHPEISFTFKRDRKLGTQTPGDNNLKNAIYSVYGMDFAKSLMEISLKSDDDISVGGYISMPMKSRGNRKLQNFFVNGRFIKSSLISKALEEGYKGSIMVSKFPACVLFLDMHPSKIDINVHPSKTEVKFSDESAVVAAIYQAVRKSIAEYNVVPKPAIPKHDKKSYFSMDEYLGNQQNLNNQRDVYSNNIKRKNGKILTATSGDLKYNTNNHPRYKDYFADDNATKKREIKREIVSDEIKRESVSDAIKDSQPQDLKINEKARDEIKREDVSDAIKDSQPQDLEINENSQINYIGELFKTYILVQIGDNFAVIDKHAAHEKMIYEDLKNDISNLDSQVLIEPEHISVTEVEKDVIFANIEVFERFGYLVEDFGKGTVAIRETPKILHKRDYKQAFIEIVQNIEDKSVKNIPITFDNLYHKVACRAAIKANDNNDKQELIRLAKRVLDDDNIRNCPHGRPVVLIFKEKDFEKRFGRKQ